MQAKQTDREYKALCKRIEKLEKKSTNNFEQIFCALKILFTQKEKRRIGFRVPKRAP